MYLLAYFSLQKRPLKYGCRSWPFRTVRKGAETWIFICLSVCVDATAANSKEKMEREGILAEKQIPGVPTSFRQEFSKKIAKCYE